MKSHHALIATLILLGVVAAAQSTRIVHLSAALAAQQDANAACRICLINAPCATPGICATECAP